MGIYWVENLIKKYEHFPFNQLRLILSSKFEKSTSWSKRIEGKKISNTYIFIFVFETEYEEKNEECWGRKETRTSWIEDRHKCNTPSLQASCQRACYILNSSWLKKEGENIGAKHENILQTQWYNDWPFRIGASILFIGRVIRSYLLLSIGYITNRGWPITREMPTAVGFMAYVEMYLENPWGETFPSGAFHHSYQMAIQRHMLNGTE